MPAPGGEVDVRVRSLKRNYRSGRDDIGESFFLPCLESAVRYRRAVGFFSSSALVTWSRVLPLLTADDRTAIELLIAPVLSEADKQVLRSTASEEARARLKQELADRVAVDALDFSKCPANEQLRLRLFAWLVASGKLQLKFAFPEHVEDPGIFHEKIGLFYFASGDVVAFTGSANETRSGYHLNYESVEVFRSWLPEDRERVGDKEAEFVEAWEGSAPGLTVLPLSPRALQYVRDQAPEEKPKLRPPRRDEQEEWKWRHQREAVTEFMKSERGVLEMATGTGKTRTALRIAGDLLRQGKVTSLIVSADGTDLLNQWYRELVKLVRDVGMPLAVVRQFERHQESDRFVLSPEGTILLASRPTLVPALREIARKNLGAKTLLIHDEVHRLGSPANRDALDGLSDTIRFRLGLSATPDREYDADGTAFIKKHVGPVIFTFKLENAIARGILCPFNYVPLPYVLSDEDREKLQTVYRQQAARAAAGDPMSDEDVWIALARVYKTSRTKLPVFKEFISGNQGLLRRCVIFVETAEFGREVLEIVHRHIADFHAYFADEDSETLRRFASGELECLLTCHRLSEGIDVRSLENVILFSSSRAKLETIQRIGRCLRSDPTNPQKIATVVDFVQRAEAGDEVSVADTERAAWLSRLAAIRPEVNA